MLWTLKLKQTFFQTTMAVGKLCLHCEKHDKGMAPVINGSRPVPELSQSLKTWAQIFGILNYDGTNFQAAHNFLCSPLLLHILISGTQGGAIAVIINISKMCFGIGDSSDGNNIFLQTLVIDGKTNTSIGLVFFSSLLFPFLSFSFLVIVSRLKLRVLAPFAFRPVSQHQQEHGTGTSQRSGITEGGTLPSHGTKTSFPTPLAF